MGSQPGPGIASVVILFSGLLPDLSTVRLTEVRGSSSHWGLRNLPSGWTVRIGLGEHHGFHFGVRIASITSRGCADVFSKGGQIAMTERRTARRYDLSLPVIIRVPVGKETSQNGKTRDISTRGVYFTIDQDLSADAELDITLTLPSEVTRGSEVFIRAMGKVVRVEKRPENGSSRVGVAAVIERYEIIRNEPVAH